jgi:hypothetical protein
MKKTFFNSIVGVAALFSVAVPSHGQGKINLNNYNNSGNQITFAPGGGGLQDGTPSGVTWSIGFYYALGDVSASVNPDPSGFGTPSGGGLALATGAVGDTTRINHSVPGGGYFSSSGDAIINGWSSGVITVEVVAYSGADYASSFARGHSAAFLFTPIASSSLQGAPAISTSTGGMPGFSVNIVPEPTAFALAGIGAGVFLFIRGKRISVSS